MYSFVRRHRLVFGLLSLLGIGLLLWFAILLGMSRAEDVAEGDVAAVSPDVSTIA